VSRSPAEGIGPRGVLHECDGDGEGSQRQARCEPGIVALVVRGSPCHDEGGLPCQPPQRRRSRVGGYPRGLGEPKRLGEAAGRGVARPRCCPTCCSPCSALG
jgi:hypothetical protein